MVHRIKNSKTVLCLHIKTTEGHKVIPTINHWHTVKPTIGEIPKLARFGGDSWQVVAKR